MAQHNGETSRFDALIEAAPAWWLGLLEREDEAELERLWAAAPRQLRDALRQQQERLAELEGLYPDVEPDPSLRSRVLLRVREAWAEARTVANAPASADAREERGSRHRRVAAAMATVVPGRGGRPRLRKVNPAWRAVSVGLSVAVVVLLVVQVQLENARGELRSQAELSQLIDVVGAQYLAGTLLDETSTRVVFARVGAEPRSAAAVWSHPDWEQSKLYVFQLPTLQDGGVYRLVRLDDADREVATLARFNGAGAFSKVDLPRLSEPMRLAIVVDGADGARVLFTAEYRLG